MHDTFSCQLSPTHTQILQSAAVFIFLLRNRLFVMIRSQVEGRDIPTEASIVGEGIM